MEITGTPIALITNPEYSNRFAAVSVNIPTNCTLYLSTKVLSTSTAGNNDSFITEEEISPTSPMLPWSSLNSLSTLAIETTNGSNSERISRATAMASSIAATAAPKVAFQIV